ncbi:hypothetical protein GH714_016448 [Hevea brasiliensis]|uniref:Malectin-like domain-containing protein n=1 Tax=Hevea brasiliensis TaxID=3981 RepID=A0A6A6LTB1_HEVBR|nr:hypothetical protein GH714_016448 [Hevea brasiliensis]
MALYLLFLFDMMMSGELFGYDKSNGYAPWVIRISCGSRVNVRTLPTNTLWYKDFAYTGGIPTNSTAKVYVAPPLKTLRYFPLSEGWSNHEDQVFTEAQVFLTDGTASICFHSTGHGDPAILSIEILEVADRAYYFGPEWGEGVILRTVTRLSCGNGKSKFDVDYSGDRWGGDRLWSRMTTFGQSSDKAISTETSIKKASNAPNFYPEALYQTALVSTDSQLDLAYTMDVDPHKNYSIWLHFAEIDVSVTDVGQRIFDILINGDVIFDEVDITKMSGIVIRLLNLSTNNIHGAIPSSLGTITSLEVLVDCINTLPYHILHGRDPLTTFFNGSIPDSIGQLTSVRRLNLNGNSLSGRVPAALGERLLHGAASILPIMQVFVVCLDCLLVGPPFCWCKIGIAFGALLHSSSGHLFVCWWKRRQNILRAQQIAARGAPYAKARIQTAHDIQMTRHHNHGYARTAAENGPSLLS